MKKISALLIFLVLAEMATLILIGNWIGVFPTLLLVLATSVFGIYLTKKTGVQSAKAVQNSMQKGQAPGVAIIDGFLSFIGGVLLIIPGFLTDILGLLMLTSLTRNLFKPIIFFWLRKKMKNSQVILYQK
mgnify:CR=1 FL=1